MVDFLPVQTKIDGLTHQMIRICKESATYVFASAACIPPPVPTTIREKRMEAIP